MQSNETNELVKAYIKAKGEMKPARKSGKNPHFKSTYSTLQDLIDATKGALAENGLAVVQTTDATDDGAVILETTLVHTSGQFHGSRWPVTPDKTGVQALGSALTYARRYSYATITGQSGDDDDDGESSEVRQPKAQPKKAPAPKTNGNGKVPTTGPQLLDLVNSRVQVPYDNVTDMRNAIAQEAGLTEYKFPKASEVEKWRTAYQFAKAGADKKAQRELEVA